MPADKEARRLALNMAKLKIEGKRKKKDVFGIFKRLGKHHGLPEINEALKWKPEKIRNSF